MTSLSGDWHSYYRYPSTARGDDFWGQNLLHATQKGTMLTLESGPDSASHIVLELEVNTETGRAIGTWQERTGPNSYYKGALYEGTIELKIADNGERMNGVWHGAGKDGEMNADIWEFAKAKEGKQPHELSKRWKLSHWYPSSNDEKEESNEHEMKAHWTGDILVLESLPAEDGSYIIARLLIQDGIAAGSWYENASIGGEYAGAQYSGAGQLVVDPETYRMVGMWAGAGYDQSLKKMRIYTGRWEIVPIAEAHEK